MCPGYALYTQNDTLTRCDMDIPAYMSMTERREKANIVLYTRPAAFMA